MSKIIQLVALDENNLIGKTGSLPWHLKPDLEAFKTLTLHNIVIMGRKTKDSLVKLNKFPLKNRTNIVITRNTNVNPKGYLIANSIDEALILAKNISNNIKDIFIIGGAEIYTQTLAKCDEVYITKVFINIETSVKDKLSYYPNLDKSEFKVFSKSSLLQDIDSNLVYQYIQYKRNNK